jgi:hypothetical protein
VIDPAGADNEPDGPLMRTLRWLSPVRHAIEALCLTELKDVPFTKPHRGLVGALASSPQMGALAGIRSGNEVLEKLGVPERLAQPMLGLGALGVLHLAAGLVALIATAPRFARTESQVASSGP